MPVAVLENPHHVADPFLLLLCEIIQNGHQGLGETLAGAHITSTKLQLSSSTATVVVSESSVVKPLIVLRQDNQG